MYSFSIIILIIILPNHTPFLLIQLFCLLLTIVMAKADLPNFFLVAGPLVFLLPSSSLQTRESCNSTDQSSLGTAHSTRMHCHTYMQRHTVFHWPVYTSYTCTTVWCLYMQLTASVQKTSCQASYQGTLGNGWCLQWRRVTCLVVM